MKEIQVVPKKGKKTSTCFEKLHNSLEELYQHALALLEQSFLMSRTLCWPAQPHQHKSTFQKLLLDKNSHNFQTICHGLILTVKHYPWTGSNQRAVQFVDKSEVKQLGRFRILTNLEYVWSTRSLDCPWMYCSMRVARIANLGKV